LPDSGNVVTAQDEAAVGGHVEHRSMDEAIDLVVAHRFKARGMSWLRRGVSAFVRLRLLRLNGTWTRY
jgi:hypothetical protein